MQGLSGVERVGCTKLLQSLQKSDLLSLCDTVTNKLIAVENDVEALETILTFSKNAEELLRRKKVQRDLIFKYLANEGLAMPPNSEKHQLVRRTLEFWSSGKAAVSGGHEDEERQTVSTDGKVEASFDPLVFGRQFCQWFFQLLNSQNLSLGQQPQGWGPQHFWPDARLRLFHSAETEEFEGAELVNLRLLALTREERLLFSPNLDEQGLKALLSPHGLMLVAVAGTIHRDEACLGVFEQMFGLIRSPMMDNSWKIKNVDLRIKGRNALKGPVTSAPALGYSSGELQLLCS